MLFFKLPMAAQLLLFCAAAATLMGFVFYLVWRQRGYFSRWMDRFELRPSQASGGLLIGFGLFCLVTIHFLPIMVLAPQVVYAFLAACVIANGVDKFHNPPTHEFRPPWYEGVGDPNWLPFSEAAKHRRFSFSLSWIGTATLVLCIALASFSSRIQQQRKLDQSHRDAIAQIEQLGGTVQKKTVTLAGTDITDADLAVLSSLEEIDELNLGGTAITNDGLKRIGQFHDLFRLNLSGTQIDDEGLGYLSDLNRLGELRLRKTNITGTGLPVRSKPSRRLILDLSLCPITKDGLVRLAKIPQLLHLDLAETEIDDSMLQELKAIHTGSLDISRTNITKAGSEEIKASTSNVSLFWSARARAKPPAAKQ